MDVRAFLDPVFGGLKRKPKEKPPFLVVTLTPLQGGKWPLLRRPLGQPEGLADVADVLKSPATQSESVASFPCRG